MLSRPRCLFLLVLVGQLLNPIAHAAEVDSYLADLRAEMTKTWPEHRRVTVVCHGHSVPTGYFQTPVLRPFDSYPHLLHVALQERYPTGVIEVIRTGIGGEHAERGAARFEQDVLAKRPDVVTIDYSLNDRSIGLDRARKAWRRMIEQAKEAGVRVILLTPTADLRSDLNDPSDPLVQHAEQVRELATEHGVGLADSLAAFNRHARREGELRSVMSQGNHPNRAGHELVVPDLLKWFTGDSQE